MKKYCIYIKGAENIEFTGKYLREKETTNWHYYETIDGFMLHFRKEYMQLIIESDADKNWTVI